MGHEASGPLRSLLLALLLSVCVLPVSAIEDIPLQGTDDAAATSSPTTAEPPVAGNDGAFATIFYDNSEDSEALLLATRVLMRSIKETKTRFRRIVIVPEDGLQPLTRAVLQLDDPHIEIVQASFANVFKQSSMTNHRTQLLHMRNKLALWDDPVLSKLKRIVYLDPENLLMKNLDEIFACKQFCAVDNGQSVVYSNSLLVISPESVAARNLYSDAIDSFMISGRSYNYMGITQGFLPGLFEALEESPLFFADGSEPDDGEAVDSVVRRLPFYYSINHMVFYERLNWDLYKCAEKNSSAGVIPGPLLSYKYSGATIKPWFWLPYAYFQVFWHWQDVRDLLNEDHFGFFLGRFVTVTMIFAFVWICYVSLVLRLHTQQPISSGGHARARRMSFGLPVAGNAPPLSADVVNSRVVRKICQVSCGLLYALPLMPLLSSAVIALVIMWASITLVPPLMYPRYAGILWLYLNSLLVLSVLIVYNLARTFQLAQWKREEEVPAGSVLLMNALWQCVWKLPIMVGVELTLLYITGRIDWFMNPVLRPVVIFFLSLLIATAQIRIMSKEMLRLVAK